MKDRNQDSTQAQGHSERASKAVALFHDTAYSDGVISIPIRESRPTEPGVVTVFRYWTHYLPGLKSRGDELATSFDEWWARILSIEKSEGNDAVHAAAEEWRRQHESVCCSLEADVEGLVTSGHKCGVLKYLEWLQNVEWFVGEWKASSVRDFDMWFWQEGIRLPLMPGEYKSHSKKQPWSQEREDFVFCRGSVVSGHLLEMRLRPRVALAREASEQLRRGIELVPEGWWRNSDHGHDSVNLRQEILQQDESEGTQEEESAHVSPIAQFVGDLLGSSPHGIKGTRAPEYARRILEVVSQLEVETEAALEEALEYTHTSRAIKTVKEKVGYKDAYSAYAEQVGRELEYSERIELLLELIRARLPHTGSGGRREERI